MTTRTIKTTGTIIVDIVCQEEPNPCDFGPRPPYSPPEVGGSMTCPGCGGLATIGKRIEHSE